MSALVEETEEPKQAAAPGCVSKWLALWVWKLVRAGELRPLEQEDIPELEDKLTTEKLSIRASELWQKEKASGEPSVIRILWQLMKCRLIVAVVTSVVHGSLAAAIRPLVLREVIRTVENLSIFSVILLFLVLVAENVCQLWMKQIIGDEGSAVTMSACTALISERIPFTHDASGTDSGKGSSGVMETQLVGNDLVRSLNNMTKLFHMVSGIVQITAGSAVLVYIVGPASFIGLAVCVITVIAASIVARVNKRNDHKGLQAADKRLALLRQILDGIRFIKSSAWEERYLEEQTKQRAEESMFNRRYRTLEAVNTAMGRATPPMACMVIFVSLYFTGQPMETADVFSCLSIFMTLRLPLGVLPDCMILTQSLLISCRRVADCLKRPDVEALPEPDQDVAAVMEDVDLSWNPELPPTLKCLSVTIPWGYSTAVVGGVAAGKSTFLLGLLHGVEATRGRISRTQGRIAYVPQRPLVFSGSVLSNILMGQPLDQRRLEKALAGAQFRRDLELMPGGLQTEIGERGTTLSGGQQTRLNIARAFYHDPRLLIADDPLAAVDVHVGSSIFRAFRDWQREGKLCPKGEMRSLVMAANQLQWLNYFDRVVYLEAGSIALQGTSEEVTSKAKGHPQLEELLESSRLAVSADPRAAVLSSTDVAITLVPKATPPRAAARAVRNDEEDFGEPASPIHQGPRVPGLFGFALRAFCLEGCALNSPFARAYTSAPSPPSASVFGKSFKNDQQNNDNVDVDDDETEKKAADAIAGSASKGVLVKADIRQRGAGQGKILLKYFLAVGPAYGLSYVIGVVGAYGFLAANDVWLSKWVKQGDESGDGDAYIYIGLSLLHLFFMFFTNFASGLAGAHASKNLHRQCLSHTLRAPMRYFDETPSGRIVSRFAADMASVDLQLPTMMDHLFQLTAMSLVLIVTVCVVMPWMCIFLIMLGPIYLRIDLMVNRSSREVKRITNNALSPVLTLLSEASGSRLMLRVMGKQMWLHEMAVHHINVYVRSHYTSMTLMTFLRLQGGLLGVLMTTCFATILWAFPSIVRSVPGGASMVGLALTYSITVPYMLSFVSMFSSFVRVYLASLERLLDQASDHVPQEREWHISSDPICHYWPTAGKLELRQATLRYQPDLPPAVKELTLTVEAGTWLAVVGRTGAGKSSLTALLLRLVELSSGSVLLDDVDTSTIGLHTLRRAIALVPQDPFFVEGALRTNLDPFNLHTNAELTEALSLVGLDMDLTTPVGKGGARLSAGQRQLAATARATLSATKVVIMDEPTANCDARTDNVLQDVAKKAFAKRTVITIAHRLNTILCYDNVLVMEAGQGVEHGPPSALAADPKTRFAEMLAASASSSEVIG
eukprot:CAMPEP_0206590928 /NCGR_PEP_ID=MMETSP0325_2-20121206/39930_1 /ASSEMBLY_ACC=CAM_ASM_000347 /TAXON_ID=2866 /ORGANISM="Crypthecodinium cohnii, Strain Seligo" /LENGTH=1350 /DNA_ID=CAMNT_0054100011 /DNA_START=57 /DNA_END=4109 /DNA_ORIENTATION=+